MENKQQEVLINKAMLLTKCNSEVTEKYDKKDYSIVNYHLKINGSSFKLRYKNFILGTFYTNLFGIKGIEDSSEAIIYCYENGIDLKIIQNVLLSIDDNKLLFTKKGHIVGIVCESNDYSSLNSLLTTVSRIRHNRIILVAGLDSKVMRKRALYGEIASSKSDMLILTENNSHYESLFGILFDITKNIAKDYYIELDRKKAIELAVSLAKPRDFIIISGKGSNNYDKVLNFTFLHNDFEILKKALDS